MITLLLVPMTSGAAHPSQSVVIPPAGQTMSLEVKIGQMLMAGVAGRTLGDDARHMIADLHAGNVMIVDDGGEKVPKLFDFNFIPFYVHAPNPAVWLALKLGLMDLRSRDARKLRTFHDFRRFERKLRRERATGLRRGVAAAR